MPPRLVAAFGVTLRKTTRNARCAAGSRSPPARSSTRKSNLGARAELSSSSNFESRRSDRRYNRDCGRCCLNGGSRRRERGGHEHDDRLELEREQSRSERETIEAAVAAAVTDR